ncbi:MAG: periplasmic heavy metal sensor [Proteobacteria bacterium]|nr:periplasmic heavy metal sensor [Pseudomonadota bacterium]
MTSQDINPPDGGSAPEMAAVRNWLPQLKSRWWTLLLGVSLMVNLLVGGLAIGFRIGDGPVERLAGISYVQLIPRNFLSQLPRERRQEIMEIVKARGAELRSLRTEFRMAPRKLADALDADTYDPAAVQAAVDGFMTASENLVGSGSTIVMEIVSKLTPGERKLLAQSIRERAERGGRRKRDGQETGP